MSAVIQETEPGRRLETRVPDCILVEIESMNSGAETIALTNNISATGLGLISNNGFCAGELITVQICGRLVATGEVVYSEQDKYTGQSRLGVRLFAKSNNWPCN